MRLRTHFIGPLAAVAVSAVAVVMPLAAGSGVAVASTASPSGSYVVASLPLRNMNTGQANWSYGYVQLWYSTSTERNWARVVSLLGGTTFNYAEVDRSDNAIGYGYGSNGSWGGYPSGYGAPVCGERLSETCSATLYSPVLTDSAFGAVEANGVTYEAQTGWY